MRIWRWLRVSFAIAGFAAHLRAGETATGVATVTAGFVTGITVTSPGSGYVSEPAVTVTGGGGSGASAKAVLAGDQVALIIVLTAGSGYTASPTVTIEAPPKLLGVRLELVPKLTVEGPAGSLAHVDSALTLNGPWVSWTNVIVGPEGTVLVDLRAGPMARFYRAVGGPAGFVWIPPGTFVMGSPESEPDREPNERQHTVTLTRGFWMSDHEATQMEYLAVMGINPSAFKGLDRPVETVTWNDAVVYCQKLTERERAAGRITAQQEYRLPTEAEWEYAARAGTTGARYGDLDSIAWQSHNSGPTTHPVGIQQANAWGLHDMIGNVWEWCSDWYGDYPAGGVTDPSGLATGSVRVFRGGSWFDVPSGCRAAFRNWYTPGNRSFNLGFRPVLSSVP